ncbi:MAG: YegP family protein [Bacteroidia bacterium]|nr:YegP family protein [Bacteroidia bacterium]
MTKFETYLGKNDEHYFRLLNDKGDILLSSEGYTKKENLINGINSVKTNITDLKNFELKTAANGKHFFNLKATNGQVIGSSTMWDSPEIRDEWMKKLKTEVPAAEILETSK